MPYIPPNSDVVLCRGVPIESDYKYTLYFDSIAAQNNYFSVKLSSNSTMCHISVKDVII